MSVSIEKPAEVAYVRLFRIEVLQTDLDALRRRIASMVVDAAHSVWEEEPAKYASVILDSIAGNWP